jgi:hypothetical protein
LWSEISALALVFVAPVLIGVRLVPPTFLIVGNDGVTLLEGSRARFVGFGEVLRTEVPEHGDPPFVALALVMATGERFRVLLGEANERNRAIASDVTARLRAFQHARALAAAEEGAPTTAYRDSGMTADALLQVLENPASTPRARVLAAARLREIMRERHAWPGEPAEIERVHARVRVAIDEVASPVLREALEREALEEEASGEDVRTPGRATNRRPR